MARCRSAPSQLMTSPPVVEVDLEPLHAEAVPHRPPLVIGVPVAEEFVAEIQGEIGVDANRQGVVGGQLQFIEALRVDPLLGDRGPAALKGGIHRLLRRAEAVVTAVADPVGVRVDESRVRHVGADVDDRHLVSGQRQHLVPRADTGHDARFDEQRLRHGRLVHRHDPADDDEATFRGPGGASGGGRCRRLVGRARWGRRGARTGERAAGDQDEHEECRRTSGRTPAVTRTWHLLQGLSAATGPPVSPSSPKPGPIPTEGVRVGGLFNPRSRRESGRPSRPPAHPFGSGQLEGG